MFKICIQTSNFQRIARESKEPSCNSPLYSGTPISKSFDSWPNSVSTGQELSCRPWSEAKVRTRTCQLCQVSWHSPHWAYVGPTVTVNVGGLGCRLHHPQSIHGPVTKMLLSQQQLHRVRFSWRFSVSSGIARPGRPGRPSQYCSQAQPPPHSQPHKGTKLNLQ